MSLVSQDPYMPGVDLAHCVLAGLPPRGLGVPDPVPVSGLGLCGPRKSCGSEWRVETGQDPQWTLRFSPKFYLKLPPPTPCPALLIPALLFSFPQHLPSSLLGHLLIHHVIAYYLIPPFEWKFHKDRHLLCLIRCFIQVPVACQVYSRGLINICHMNEWMNELE